MRLGIFGGTFDPIHLAHLRVAEEVASALDLDRVVFVPAGHPPHRPKPRATAQERLAMVCLAIAGNPRFAVTDLETRRRGPSYTVDTLRELRRRLGGERLVLILGADAASQLPRWRAADEVARLAEIAVLTRPGVPEVASAFVKHLVATPAIEISASDIRARCLTGKSIRYLVPDAVADYIATHRLYQ